ncbi:MAG: sulfatase-like hydrolase/transferase, partial [Halanaerobiales bacterium]
ILLTIAAIITIFLLLHYLFTKEREYKFGKGVLYLSFVLIILSVIINPTTYDIYEIYRESNREVSFNKYYQEPSIEKIGENKNLVFIYAESLERTYFNDKLFPGLIEGLRELENRSVYFTDIRQVAGTSWTIGGMVSSQMGLPLFTPITSKEMHEMDVFLPLAKGVGDLLSKQGYHLTYYGGAELKFQGKGKFYASHGFDEIYGENNLRPLMDDPDYLSNWGLYDSTLLDLAYDKYLTLSESKDKFGLFLVTLGTHHPYGHVPKGYRDVKYKEGDNSILNAVKVTDLLITDFVKDIMNSEYAKDTVIVIASDHLAMRNTAFDTLEKGKRRNMFMILSPERENPLKITKRGSTLDIGPTIMPFLGFKTKLGLGRNLLDEHISSYEIKKIHDNLISWKEDIQYFWGELAE